jgi:hypothetical protein
VRFLRSLAQANDQDLRRFSITSLFAAVATIALNVVWIRGFSEIPVLRDGLVAITLVVGIGWGFLAYRSNSALSSRKHMDR